MQAYKRNYDEFSVIRRKVKQIIRRDYNLYLKRVQDAVKNDPKYFWTYIRGKKGHPTLPGKVYLHDTFYDRPLDIVNAFADFFKSSVTFNKANLFILLTTEQHPVAFLSSTLFSSQK